jgi:acyl carrier protein
MAIVEGRPDHAMDLDTFSRTVVNFLIEARPDLAARIAPLGVDDDMFEAGVVDSGTFLDLCLALEEQTGDIIDITESEPEQFSTIRGLFDLALAP